MLFRAASDKCADLRTDQNILSVQSIFTCLWPERIIVVPQISGSCCGTDILFYVWICSVLSDPPRDQGLDLHSDLPPCSLFPLFLPSSSCCYFCLLPFSLNLLLMLSNPVFCLCPPSLLSLLCSPPLPGAMWHTQGRMMMMMVQMMMKLTLSKFCSQSYSQKPPPPCLILPPIPPSFWKQNAVRMRRETRRKASCLCWFHPRITTQAHPTITPILAALVCVDIALCLCLITTNSNTYFQNSIIRKQGQRNIQAGRRISFSNVHYGLGCAWHLSL